MNLANRTIKNALYGFVSYVWPIVFSLALTPIIIRKLGVEQYGIYMLTLVIGSFFSLLHFGLVYTFVRELAKIRTSATEDELKYICKLYGATVLIFLFLGIFSFFISLGIAHFGLGLFNLSQGQYAVGRIVFYLMGVTAFLNSIGIVYSHIPYALQRQDIGTGIYIVNVILTNIFIIGSLSFGYGLLALVGLQTASSLFNVVAAYWYSKKLLPSVAPEYTLESKIVKPMFQFGGYIYLHNISASFLSQIDRIIISGSIGPTALTLYSLPNSVAEKTQGIVVSLSGILFPVMSELTKDGDVSRVRRAYHEAIRMIALLASGITTTILLLADKTLLFWVGKDLAVQSTHLIYWLAPTYFLLALFLPTTHVLAGMGRTKFLGVSSLVMAVLNIVLLFILLPLYGITGAAMAYFFSLVPLIYIFYYIERYFLEEKYVGRLYGELCFKLLCTSLVFVVFGLFILKPLVVNLSTLLVVGMISVVLYIGLYRLLGFLTEEEWQRFKDFGRMISARIFSRT